MLTLRLYSTLSVQIDLEALAKWAGTDFICGKVVGMTLPPLNGNYMTTKKMVQVEIADESTVDNAPTIQDIPFDVVSIDIGSTTRQFTTVSGASRYCISTRPISDLVRRIEAEERIVMEKLR